MTFFFSYILLGILRYGAFFLFYFVFSDVATFFVFYFVFSDTVTIFVFYFVFSDVATMIFSFYARTYSGFELKMNMCNCIQIQD